MEGGGMERWKKKGMNENEGWDRGMNVARDGMER